jgi:hypothetical protein
MKGILSMKGLLSMFVLCSTLTCYTLLGYRTVTDKCYILLGMTSDAMLLHPPVYDQ